MLLVEEYQPPWAITIPDGGKLSELIPVTTGTKIVPFHLVRRGSFELHSGDARPLVVRAGEVAICTGSQQHTIINGTPEHAVPFSELLGERPLKSKMADLSGVTELVCGVFMLRNTRNNPLIESLPPIVHVDVSGGTESKTLQLLTELLINELEAMRSGQGFMSDRVLEMLCAEAIRVHMENGNTSSPGWFRGLKDPKIGVILNRIHAGPSEQISVGMLARMVGMSQSRFAVKFRTLLGETPMSYVGRWRMNVAARLLTDTDLGTEEIAMRVGYQSLPAFARAFRKHFGCPPVHWRREQQM